MAKKKYTTKAGGKSEKYEYPSHFGSHKSMVDEEATKQLSVNNIVKELEQDSIFTSLDKLVVCRDGIGLYLTEEKRLDNGLSDVHRNTTKEFRKERLERVGIAFE